MEGLGEQECEEQEGEGGEGKCHTRDLRALLAPTVSAVAREGNVR